MSDRELLQNSICKLEDELDKLDIEIKLVEEKLKSQNLSDEERDNLVKELKELDDDRQELVADIAMLEEELDRMEFQEEPSFHTSGFGLDWNESGYFD